MLLFRNPLTFGIVHGLGNIFMFLGKCMITACTVLVGYMIIMNVEDYSESISSPIVPCVVYAVEGYIVAVLFMSVWA